MHAHAICALMLLLAASLPAWAVPVIDAGTHYLLPDDVRTIAIAVSGGDQVNTLNFFVQIADGIPPGENDPAKPVITGINIIGPGALFSQSNVGSLPWSLPGSGGLIWQDFTFTQSGVNLNATGTLAYVTIDTTNTHTTDPAYALNLAGVAANYDPPGYNTNFDLVTPTINPGWIVITDLRDLTWNASASGAWTATTWDGALPAYPTCPNYTSNAIVNTHFTVNVSSAQEANSLSLSNGGQVAISTAGSLALTTSAAIANGSVLQVDGILNAQNISLDGSMNLAAGGSASVANIIGAGTLSVGDGLTPSSLMADSIETGVLTIAAGSTVTIQALPGGPQAGGTLLTPVPEPSMLALLAAAAAAMILYRRKTLAA